MPVAIDRIFYRRLTDADLFNIEKGQVAIQGKTGAGQTYIDIPETVVPRLFEMVGAVTEPEDRKPVPITAKVIGGNATGTIMLGPRNQDPALDGRYCITKQNRQFAGAARHPAWTSARGFPTAPNNIATKADVAALPKPVIFLVRTTAGELWAGFSSAQARPAAWPVALDPLFTSSVGVIHLGSGLLGENGRRVLEAWSRSPNVLLYGPPGTGKTHLLNEMRSILTGAAVPTVTLDTTNATTPFQAGAQSVPLPTPVQSAFVTFHQNYGYEDFIVGLRPHPGPNGGVALVPRFGVLLDLILPLSGEVDGAAAVAGSAVLFVDEINRGNVSRIFGEFITFMELGYRATLADGSVNPSRLPVPLHGIDIDGARTVPVDRPSGGKVRLKVPWHFPRHVYTLATMNSVDRAVAPLDTALARRFARVALRPDMELLAQWLEIADTDALLRRIEPQNTADEEEDDAAPEVQAPGDAQELTPWETGWLLLRRINDELAGSFGPDFELGHVYMMDLKDVRNDADAWLTLARIWDDRLFPQLVDRFTMRPDELTRLLKVRATPPAGYLFRERQLIGRRSSPDSRGAGIVDVALTALLATEKDHVVATLRFLAKP